MGRLGCFFIVIAVVAMAALVVLPVIGPFRDNALLMSVQAAINCPSGYTFENEFTTYNPRPGEIIEAATGYCISPTGQRTQMNDDAQGRYFLIAAGAFVVPFLIGLFMIIGASNRATNRRMQDTMGGAPAGQTLFGSSNLAVPVNSTVINSPPGTLHVQGNQLDPAAAEAVRRMTGIDMQRNPDGSVRVQMPGMSQPITVQGSRNQPPTVISSSSTAGFGGVTLAERLKQLDEAKTQGLISQEEYDRLRQAILDEML